MSRTDKDLIRWVGIPTILLVAFVLFLLFATHRTISEDGMEQCMMFGSTALTCSPTKDWTYKCRCPCT